MQPHPRHHPVHQEGSARQVPAAVEEGEQGKEDGNLWQEDHHRSHAGHDAVHEQVVERPLRQRSAEPSSERAEGLLDARDERVCADEHELEEQPHRGKEEERAGDGMGDDAVNPVAA